MSVSPIRGERIADAWRASMGGFCGIALMIALLATCNISPAAGVSRADPDLASVCRDGSKRIPPDPRAPLADENLQLLALRFSTGLHADEFVYKRLVRDIGAIRGVDPRVANVRYFAPNDGRTVRLFFDSDKLRKVKSHQYTNWNCLNSYFGASVGSVSQLGFVEIHFRELYKLEPVLELYKGLAGVTMVDTSHMLGDSSTIYVSRETSRWVYVFDVAGGDCPSGCTKHEIYYFAVSSEGVAREIASESDPKDPLPDWVKLYFGRYR